MNLDFSISLGQGNFGDLIPTVLPYIGLVLIAIIIQIIILWDFRTHKVVRRRTFWICGMIVLVYAAGAEGYSLWNWRIRHTTIVLVDSDTGWPVNHGTVGPEWNFHNMNGADFQIDNWDPGFDFTAHYSKPNTLEIDWNGPVGIWFEVPGYQSGAEDGCDIGDGLPAVIQFKLKKVAAATVP